MRWLWLVSGACTWIPPEEGGDRAQPSGPEPSGPEPSVPEPDTDAPPDETIPEIPVLQAMVPGSAGRLNLLLVSDAQPGAELGLWSSVATERVEVPGCEGVRIDADAPVVQADDDGRAALEVMVDAALAGGEASYRVVQLADCSGSEPLTVTFPVTLERSLDQADAIFYGEASPDFAGCSVAGAGDVDGDGYDDFLIGAQGHDLPYTNAGATYLFYGPVSGTMSLASAPVKLVGGVEYANAGGSVSSAGDVNGDGFADILVGASHGPALANEGKAYLLYGPVLSTASLATADATFLGEEDGDQAGSLVSEAGDVDDDGFDDILVDTVNGPTYLLSGPLSGVIGLGGAQAAFVETHRIGALDSAGDVNGDGYGDILLGEGGIQVPGAAYLLSGPLSGLIDPIDAEAQWTGEGEADEAGKRVAGVGDTNGDGYDDILIGAPQRESRRGTVYLFLGPVSGQASVSQADAKMRGERSSDYAGLALCRVGDDDGYADVLIGALGNSTNLTVGYQLRGPLLGAIDLADAETKFVANEPTYAVGRDLCGVGDVDGDDLPDILVGFQAASESSGAAHLFLSSSL